MPYASASEVANLCGNLINAASNFSASTTPTLTAVNGWLSSGSSIINARLKARGYSLPTTSDDVYSILTELNALFAAAKAEMSRANVRLSPGERTRGQVFMDDFETGLKEFLAGDMSRAGLTYTHAGYVGGISESDKDSVESDSDRIPTRFRNDQFKNTGIGSDIQERDS